MLFFRTKSYNNTFHQIDGAAFGELNEDDIKGIVKPVGIVKKFLVLKNS